MRMPLLGTVLLATLVWTPAAAAQVPGAAPNLQNPRLVGALNLARDGQTDSARSVVAGVLAATATTDPGYPEALYVAGLVAANATEAQRYYQRVAVEYSYSEWADDALLKLAQYDFANGNAPGATRNVDKLARDYPDSPVLAQGAYWGVRAALAVNDNAAACRWVSLGLDHLGPEDVETGNQLRYFSGRCAGVTPPAMDSAASDSAAPAPPAPMPTPPAATGPEYYVQVAAVSTQAAADQVIADLKAAGHRATTVTEGGLLKVRVGPLADRAAADAAVRAIRERLGGQPFVVTVP